jgi:signal transduction histidine kinase/ActR/RegA family two-component response regulator
MPRFDRLLLPVAFVVATSAMPFVGGLGYRSLRLAAESSRAVARTQQVLMTLEDILSHVFSGETAARSYETTGRESDLEPLTRAQRSLPGTVDAAAALTTDNFGQQRRMPQLRRQITEIIDALNRIVANRRLGHPVTSTATEQQKAAMDRLRETLREMRLEEGRLLKEHVEADERATRTTQTAVLSIVGVSGVLLACVFMLLVRDTAKRQRLTIDLQRANEDLEARVEARTVELRQALERELEARHQAQEANRLKDEFLMTVSHELRTPLTALYGWARMLATGEVRHGQERRAIDAIERNAAAQTQLVNDLLDVSRTISGKLRLDVRAVDLKAVVVAAIDSIQPAADAKDIRVQAVLDPSAGPVAGDPDRLQQVSWNLLSNAVKFTPKGGRVQIRLERVNSHVELIVSDSGSGIAPEFLPFVFDRFRQGQTGTARQHTGLGLGLAIVRHLVELHGGTVRAESSGLGEGATFRVLLPLTIASHDATDPGRIHPAAIDRSARHPPRRLDAIRVLVVDDEPQARDLFSAILENAGADVRSAASAADALALIQAWLPTVLVSDIEMPNEDGYVLMQRVRELGFCDVLRAIAVTAHARPEDRVGALEAGFQWHLAKPIEPSELISVIASLAVGLEAT